MKWQVLVLTRGSGRATVRARFSERLGGGADGGRVVGHQMGAQVGLRGTMGGGEGSVTAGRTVSIHTAWDLSNLLRTTYGAGFLTEQSHRSTDYCLITSNVLLRT
jgi:hypothetical protein